MLQVMLDIASYIEVPRGDVTDGRVYEPPRTTEQLRRYPPLLRIHSGDQEPQDAFASVQYRNHWYWLDDRDVPTKPPSIS